MVTTRTPDAVSHEMAAQAIPSAADTDLADRIRATERERLRLYGDAAAIQYRSNTEIVVGGEQLVLHNWHTDLYEQRDGRWQVVWSQATSIH